MKTMTDLIVMKKKADAVINSTHYGLKAKQLAKYFRDEITKRINHFEGETKWFF